MRLATRMCFNEINGVLKKRICGRCKSKISWSEKMKKIAVNFEYGCYPLWIYGESGRLIDTGLPMELQEDKVLDKLFISLQHDFDKLFIDTPAEFRYIGFENEREKKIFIKK